MPCVQIEQLREDFERERTQLVDQIDQKDKQIADMIETVTASCRLIASIGIPRPYYLNIKKMVEILGIALCISFILALYTYPLIYPFFDTCLIS